MGRFCALIFSENMFSAFAHFCEWKIQTMDWSQSPEEDALMESDQFSENEEEGKDKEIEFWTDFK